MRKKGISLLMAMCMSLVVMVPTSAINIAENDIDLAVTNAVREMIEQYPIEERIEEARYGNIDENVGEEIREAGVFSILPDNENLLVATNNLTEEIESNVDYTVKDLGEVVINGRSIGTLYSATAAEKTKSGSSTMKEAKVEAYLSIVWIDNFGPSNVLVEVSGGWNKSGTNITENPMVRYSAKDLEDFGDEATKFPDGYSFTYSNINFKGLTIEATSYLDVWVNSTSGSGHDTKLFMFHLSPTIFD